MLEQERAEVRALGRRLRARRSQLAVAERTFASARKHGLLGPAYWEAECRRLDAEVAQLDREHGSRARALAAVRS